MKQTKLCPLLTHSIIVHNTSNDARVFPIGINALRDNDVIILDFLPCKQENCMMYDVNNDKCTYCKK